MSGACPLAISLTVLNSMVNLISGAYLPGRQGVQCRREVADPEQGRRPPPQAPQIRKVAPELSSLPEQLQQKAGMQVMTVTMGAAGGPIP